MKIEHFAFNVEEPVAMTKWYTENLGLVIVRQLKEPPYTAFLSDSSGRIMIEIYKNPPEDVPDYSSMDPLMIHLAFVSEDPAADKTRLEKAGAVTESDEKLDDGSHLVMLRDPWGFCIQLCKRGNPMLASNEK